jgi:hypothetical protein
MLQTNDYITCNEASRLYSSTYPDRPRLSPSTIRSWANNPKHPMHAIKYRGSIAVGRESFVKVINDGWPKEAGARHPKHIIAKARAGTTIETETVADAGYTAHLDEATTVKLVDVKRRLGAARLNDVIRICIERIHSEMEHVQKPEERPLAVFGQGDYKREIREEDC